MALDTYARLAGQSVELSEVSGPFRPCRHCGGKTAYVGKGTGPHAAQLRCATCDTHASWLSRDHLAAMAAARRLV